LPCAISGAAGVHPDRWRWQKERRRNRRLKSGFDISAPAGRISIFKALPARFLLPAGLSYYRRRFARFTAPLKAVSIRHKKKRR
jgi:hypothetical protein